MTYSLHIPEKKGYDKLKTLIKEGQRLTGLKTHRLFIKALSDLIIAERKAAQ